MRMLNVCGRTSVSSKVRSEKRRAKVWAAISSGRMVMRVEFPNSTSRHSKFKSAAPSEAKTVAELLALRRRTVRRPT